jgi:hypothetical protein
VGSEREAFFPPDLVDRVLRCAGDELVLIGGQALAFWMDRYGIAHGTRQPAISRDVDFFTADAANSAPLHRFAKAMYGQAQLVDRHTMSALVGSAVAPAEGDLIYNVDLLHAVVGLDREEILANAMDVRMRDGTRFRVMHPLDVLQSRNANLDRLREKQDHLGQQQFRLAIDVARAWLLAEIESIEAEASLPDEDRERAKFDLLGPVDEYSTQDAAKKNAARYGIHLADAIPAWRIASPVFWSKQWQFLRARMSPAYAAECERRRDEGRKTMIEERK